MTQKLFPLAVLLATQVSICYSDTADYSAGSKRTTEQAYPLFSPMPTTDELVIGRIWEEILRDRTFSDNAKHINISVYDGNVTLRGMVDSDDERTRLENKVRQVNGVRTIDNKLYLPNIF